MNKTELKELIEFLKILNNKEFHYNLTRPGIFLYGGYQNKRLKKILKIKSVIKLKAKILQIKEIGANEYIGYNQTYKTKKTIKVPSIYFLP